MNDDQESYSTNDISSTELYAVINSATPDLALLNPAKTGFTGSRKRNLAGARSIWILDKL